MEILHVDDIRSQLVPLDDGVQQVKELHIGSGRIVASNDVLGEEDAVGRDVDTAIAWRFDVRREEAIARRGARVRDEPLVGVKALVPLHLRAKERYEVDELTDAINLNTVCGPRPYSAVERRECRVPEVDATVAGDEIDAAAPRRERVH